MDHAIHTREVTKDTQRVNVRYVRVVLVGFVVPIQCRARLVRASPLCPWRRENSFSFSKQCRGLIQE